MEENLVIRLTKKYERTMVFLFITFSLFLVGIVIHTYLVQHQIVKETALQEARTLSDALSSFRTLYTSEVVERVKTHGVTISHDYDKIDSSIPLPATLSMRLGELMGKINESRSSSRLYSPYPFPTRQETGGLRDDFQKKAWESLKARPEQAYFEFVSKENRLRFATADIMRKSCVNCHNTHRDTPKRDWKVGELRGVLEVDLSLKAIRGNVDEAFQSGVLVLLLVAFLSAAIGFVIMITMRKSSRQVQDAQQDLEFKNIELKQEQLKLLEQQERMDQRRRQVADNLIEIEKSQSATLNLLRDIEKEKDRADHASKAKSEFLATMSHEIRTPMNGVIGMTQFLMETRLNDEQREYVKTIHNSGDSLLTIINDILDFSKIEAGKMSLEKTLFMLKEPVEDLIKIMEFHAKEKGIDLLSRFEGDLPEYVMGDSGRYRQILTNLLGNALKFTEKGQIEITIEMLGWQEDECELEVRVEDTGVGIPEERLERVFESFTQADSSTTRQFGGTGLGLTITRRLCELMGGSIRAESEVGKGSAFIFRIKFFKADEKLVEESKLQSSRNTPVEQKREEAKSLKVLVVDDNQINLKVACKMVEKMGHVAIRAADGHEAITCFQNMEIDVILMDMQMPELDGIEATKRIREMGQKGRDIPIIALTANVLSSDRDKCLAAGMDDILTKPIHKDKLMAMLLEHEGRLS